MEINSDLNILNVPTVALYVSMVVVRRISIKQHVKYTTP